MQLRTGGFLQGVKAKQKETPQMDSDEHRFYRSKQRKQRGVSRQKMGKRLYRRDAEAAEKRRDGRKDGRS